jgi:ribosomal protein S27E
VKKKPLLRVCVRCRGKGCVFDGPDGASRTCPVCGGEDLKKAAPPPPCKHKELHFDDGGLHLVCSNCGQAWQAVNKERLVPEFMARGWGFTAMDKRKDPFT